MRSVYLIVLFLGITFISFIPSLNNGFMNTWDDEVYVTGNPVIRELNASSVHEMFTEPVNASYVPLPLLTFAIEYKFFGYNPFFYHLTNLLLHLLCTLLVYGFLRLLRIPPIYAAIGALLFGIHPMRVESVAWITERKDLLYSIFYLVSMIFYIKFLDREKRKARFFILSLLFFLLAVFSKIQACTLPLSLLLIDYYRERPLKLKLLVEKIPYFLPALIIGVAGLLIFSHPQTLKPEGIINPVERIFYGLYSLGVYIFRFFIPAGQSVLYFYPGSSAVSRLVLYFIIPFLVLVLVYLVIRTARFSRVIVFGTLFFLVNIIFLLQIFTVEINFLCDRYTYIPYIGFILIAAWFLERNKEKGKVMKYLALLLLGLVVILFATMTWNRCKVWKNGETLWTDVIEKYPERNARPYYNLGLAYLELGVQDKSVDEFSMAIRLDRNYYDAYYNRGVILLNRGFWPKAISDFTNAIKLNPSDHDAYTNRGVAFVRTAQWDRAILDFTRAIEIDPNNSLAYYNRSIAYRELMEIDKAKKDMERAMTLEKRTH